MQSVNICFPTRTGLTGCKVCLSGVVAKFPISSYYVAARPPPLLLLHLPPPFFWGGGGLAENSKIYIFLAIASLYQNPTIFDCEAQSFTLFFCAKPSLKAKQRCTSHVQEPLTCYFICFEVKKIICKLHPGLKVGSKRSTLLLYPFGNIPYVLAQRFYCGGRCQPRVRKIKKKKVYNPFTFKNMHY